MHFGGREDGLPGSEPKSYGANRGYPAVATCSTIRAAVYLAWQLSSVAALRLKADLRPALTEHRPPPGDENRGGGDYLSTQRLCHVKRQGRAMPVGADQLDVFDRIR